jgi:hypothetical protein
MKNLFVDDLRAAPKGWIRARTITEAIRLLAHFKFEKVSLDYDIAYMDERGEFTGKCNDENYSSVAHFIAGMPRHERPRVVYVHTANPDGAKQLVSILKDKVRVIRTTQHEAEWAQLDGLRRYLTESPTPLQKFLKEKAKFEAKSTGKSIRGD